MSKDVMEFNPIVALITTPNLETARRLADLFLSKHACACAQLIQGLESHYWWEGKIESSIEVLLILKTSIEKKTIIEEIIKYDHPYMVPQLVYLPIEGGLESYLLWMKSQIG